MPPESLRFRRLGARLTAAAATGLMAAGAFAAPATAQDNPFGPFLHGDLELTDVAPGSTVEVTPTFYQEEALDATTAALVAHFSDPYGGALYPLDGAEAIADFDNCVESPDSARGGVECVITDFTDQPGTPMTFTGPVEYAIAADALGPLDVCSCTFHVGPVDQATLESEFGGVFWDETSENLLGVTSAETWDPPVPPDLRHGGDITIITSANPSGLSVTGASFTGDVGERSTVTVQVANDGPATIYNRSDDYGSASIRAQLPPGTELDVIDSDGSQTWRCLNQASLETEYSRTTTALDHYDLYCFLMTPLTAGETVDFTFTALLTGESDETGLVEIANLTTGPDGESLESSLDDNVGVLENLGEKVVLDRYDYTGDGYKDVVAVRKADGALVIYAGRKEGTFSNPQVEATGWGRMDLVMAGDLTADGLPDLLARDNRTGYLYTYPGDGDGGFDTRLLSGTGWYKMGPFTTIDWDGDGSQDLLAVRKSNGMLYYYPGHGDGTFGSAVELADGYNYVDRMVNTGDVDQDGYEDFMVRFGQTQEYYLFLSTGGEPVVHDPWLADTTDEYRRYSQITGIGDMNSDGYQELLLVDSRTGELLRQTLGHNGGLHSSIWVAGTGWGRMRLPSVGSDRTYDYTQDGGPDIVARYDSTGTTYLYTGDGTGGFDTRVNWGSTFDGMNLLETAGDFTGDGLADLIGRVASTGSLYVYPGNGYGGYDYDARVRIGTGWNVMGTIVSGQDFNGDGKVDILAGDKSTGYLWLYPGTATGKVTSRIKIGTGWDKMEKIVATADLDHDGHADLLAVRKSNNCMYFYGGKGTGGVQNGVELGCGWGGMDSVASVGDFDGDGHADFVARRKSDGKLFLYGGNGAGDFLTAVAVGTGWNVMDIIA